MVDNFIKSKSLQFVINALPHNNTVQYNYFSKETFFKGNIKGSTSVVTEGISV